MAALAVVCLVAFTTLAGAAPAYDDVGPDVGVFFRQAGEVHESGDGEGPVVGFPEIIGGGACFADLDGDGLDDLYLVSQQFNPENEGTVPWGQRQLRANALYWNQGDGTFVDGTAEAGVEALVFGYGCSAADYDGDGFMDLYVTTYGDERWGGNLLYHNQGDGTFEDVAEAAGVSMLGACAPFACMGTNSAWGDYDLDGDLDLYVANYVDSPLDDGVHGPQDHVAQPNWLFRNEGDGRFTEVAEAAGVRGDVVDVGGSKSFAVVWFDHDLDGDLDLYVANDSEPNDFYENNGDGTFTDRSVEAGLDDRRAGMGLAVGDYDGDGWPDIFITHFIIEEYGFYRNLGDGTYEDRSGEDDLDNASDHVGWGTAFVDHDRDGDLDIFSASGHTFSLPAEGYAQPTRAWRNDPPLPGDPPWDRVWTDVSEELGAGLPVERVSRGAAFADFDLDGDTDIAVNNNANDTAQFLRASGVEGHFLNVRLAQPGTNRYAIGARVVLEAEGLGPQHREVQAGSSFLSQNTLQLEFGLGGSAKADRVTVLWPDGGTTVVEEIASDQTVRIDRATGSVTTDVVSPLTTVLAVGEEGWSGWYRSAVTIALSPVDRGSPAVSGLVSTEVALGDAPWSAYAAPFQLQDDGRYVVAARSTDAVGNVEPRRAQVVGIDRIAPSATHDLQGTQGANGWWVAEPVTVVLQGADDRSGIREIRYRIDGGPWDPYDGAFAIEADGVHILEYVPVDQAGNEGPAATVEIALDLTSPESSPAHPLPGALLLDGKVIARIGRGPAVVIGATETRLAVRADAADAASGVDRVAFVVDGEVRAVARAGPPWTWVWDLAPEKAGLHRLEIVAIDRAGNLGLSDLDIVVLSSGRLVGRT